MNVSWSDLNNVQEAGDYPFRDGKIAVSFAEIAVWKVNPDAQFQLMRKHPILSEFRYVLGREIKEKSTPADPKLIYESSNGDSWSLTQNPLTGAPAVMHRPNPSSGGQTSYIEIDKFLSKGANGPEHEALRRLRETDSRMSTILIAYDIHYPKGKAYDDLIDAIQSLGTWWHHLESIWIVKSLQTPGEIRDQLKAHLGTDDQLLVIDVSRANSDWAGINSTGSKWLDDNIKH